MHSFSQSLQDNNPHSSLATTSAASLELRNISKVYPTKKGNVTAVSEANFQINPGEFVTLLGPSGCGKTTILRMISGFETPTTGEILLDNHNIVSVSPAKRPMSMVFQSYALFPHLSVRKNVAFGLTLKKDLTKENIKERVDRAMQAMDILEYADRGPHELSGGQQQRVALARALVMEPRVLLFDEPLSNLDAKLREQMRYEIRRLQQELGITSIFVTHDQDEAMSMSDKIVVMQRGKIAQIGSPQEVYRYPSSRFVAEFLGSANFFSVTVKNPKPSANLTNADPSEMTEQFSEQTSDNSDHKKTKVTGAPIDTSIATLQENLDFSSLSVELAEHTLAVPAAPTLSVSPSPIVSTSASTSPVLEALLVARAEDLKLVDNLETDDNLIWKIPGTVKSAIFHGDAINYLINTGEYGQIKVKVSGKSPVKALDSQVFVLISPSSSWVIPIDNYKNNHENKPESTPAK